MPFLSFSFFFFKKFFTKLSEQTNQKKINVQQQMKIGGRLKNVLLVISNLPCFFSSKGGSAVGPLTPHHMDFCFHDSSQLIPRMEGESGWGDKRRREGSGEGNGGWMVVWWEDQTHCNAKKTSTPSSPPRALHPNRLFLPPLLRLGGSNLHRLDLVHLCPHHLDAVEDLLLMAC